MIYMILFFEVHFRKQESPGVEVRPRSQKQLTIFNEI